MQKEVTMQEALLEIGILFDAYLDHNFDKLYNKYSLDEKIKKEMSFPIYCFIIFTEDIGKFEKLIDKNKI